MKLKLVILNVLFISVFLFSCMSVKYSQNSMQKLKWMEGKWEYQEDSIFYRENWIWQENIGLTGKIEIQYVGEIIYMEDIEIQLHDGNIQFKSKSNIYKEEDEYLLLKKLKSKVCLFSNTQGDHQVEYSKTSKGQMVVIITELQDGKPHKTKYLLNRKP